MMKGLDRLAAKVAQVRRTYPVIFRQMIKAASDEMATAAAEATPPLNGEDRGKNTVTGNLAAHWDYTIARESDTVTKITLINDLEYASFVDQGHRMDEHFVPWLFIDGLGVISRHIPTPGEGLFGLTVGTKTEYVDGYNMTEKSKKRFVESLTNAHANVMREMNGILGGIE